MDEVAGSRGFGLDISTVTTSRSRENCLRSGDRLHLVQSDIRGIPFATGSFDFVYTMGTIEHIEEYQQAVDEVARVLKPGGIAVVGRPPQVERLPPPAPRRRSRPVRPVPVRAREVLQRRRPAPGRGDERAAGGAAGASSPSRGSSA
jgi:SAM-dependent methyltransferase